MSLGQLEQSFFIEELKEPITLDSSELAREIKNYRCIFDNFLRRDKFSVTKAWENICAKMLPNFATMTPNEQIVSRKRLRERWSYMRATYRRNIFNNKIFESHNYLKWLKEMDFLLPILKKSTNKNKINKNIWRSGKSKRSPTNKELATSSTIKTCYTSQKSPIIDSVANGSIPMVDNEIIVATCSNATATAKKIPSIPVTEATTPISDGIVFCNSTDSDDTSDMDASTNTTTSTSESTEENKIENDLLIEAFVSTFSLESFFTSTIDPDQIFLLTLLQNYRLVSDEKKEALQHKFYTFLRD